MTLVIFGWWRTWGINFQQDSLGLVAVVIFNEDTNITVEWFQKGPQNYLDNNNKLRNIKYKKNMILKKI